MKTGRYDVDFIINHNNPTLNVVFYSDLDKLNALQVRYILYI